MEEHNQGSNFNPRLRCPDEDDRRTEVRFFPAAGKVVASGKFTNVSGNYNVHNNYYILNGVYYVPNEPSSSRIEDSLTKKAENIAPFFASGKGQNDPADNLRRKTVKDSQHPRPENLCQTANMEGLFDHQAFDKMSLTVQNSTLRRLTPSPSHAANGEGDGHTRIQPSLQEISSRFIDLKARAVPQVFPPVLHKPKDNELFIADESEMKVASDYLKSHLYWEGRLKESQAIYILERATYIFSLEGNMVQIQSPVTICGDIRGQFYDLLNIFREGGEDSTYIFLGNYINGGNFGIECLLYLYSLKICNPDNMILLRGNHECRNLAEDLGFKCECLHKYSERVYEACLRSFVFLPVAALVDDKCFCVHAGISPQLNSLDDLAAINRSSNPGSAGLLCDLLWSDPISNYGNEIKPPEEGPALERGITFTHNTDRHCSVFYTYDAVCQFLDRNGLFTLIRGHEPQPKGYKMYKNAPNRDLPSIITVFSAPNFLDANHSAIIQYTPLKITIKTYDAVPHPYWLPSFMNVFEWSMPMVGAHLVELVHGILGVCSTEELYEGDSADDDDAAEYYNLAIRAAKWNRQQDLGCWPNDDDIPADCGTTLKFLIGDE